MTDNIYTDMNAASLSPPPWGMGTDLRSLFCDGTSVKLFQGLKERPGRPDWVESDRVGTWEFSQLNAGTSDTARLLRILDAKGHGLPEGKSAENFSRSLARIGEYFSWMNDVFCALRENAFGTTAAPDTTCGSRLAALQDFHQTIGLQPFEPRILELGRTETPIAVLIKHGTEARLITMHVFLQRVQSPLESESLTHFPSSLNAFLLFDNDWLCSFDHALTAARNTVLQAAGAGREVEAIKANLALRWHLELQPFWNRSFANRDAASKMPFEGASASASFALAVTKLLAGYLATHRHG